MLPNTRPYQMIGCFAVEFGTQYIYIYIYIRTRIDDYNYTTTHQTCFQQVWFKMTNSASSTTPMPDDAPRIAMVPVPKRVPMFMFIENSERRLNHLVHARFVNQDRNMISCWKLEDI